ncbi:unnamed protein product [Pleuronectes platessa]|uniref:Uncharacterized protein n=1 Tax=Pleuronectes platessa TaxID=8262 RepID=A0A9N7UI44_PLEPL|nr:unnamed protein product [Pleuronectes platessa]
MQRRPGLLLSLVHEQQDLPWGVVVVVGLARCVPPLSEVVSALTILTLYRAHHRTPLAQVPKMRDKPSLMLLALEKHWITGLRQVLTGNSPSGIKEGGQLPGSHAAGRALTLTKGHCSSPILHHSTRPGFCSSDILCVSAASVVVLLLLLLLGHYCGDQWREKKRRATPDVCSSRRGKGC